MADTFTLDELLAGEHLRLDETCQLWEGSTNGAGYGQRHLDDRYWLTHRLAWVQAFGEIPPGQRPTGTWTIGSRATPLHAWPCSETAESSGARATAAGT